MKRTLTTPEFANYPDDWHFSPVLDTGDFLFFSGVTGTRADLSVAADAETQFRDAFGFLKANLAAADLTFDDVVEMTTYHVDLRRHLGAFFRHRHFQRVARFVVASPTRAQQYRSKPYAQGSGPSRTRHDSGPGER